MDPERPPQIDADYRVVHGPWPRWVLQLSLLRLALRTAGIVVVLCVLTVVVAMLILRG
jgi:hypothetical protein